jgi:hypothetical protein
VAIGVAGQVMLADMPDSRDLRLLEVDGQVLVLVGQTVVAGWAAGDAPMRNLAVVTMRNLGFAGQRVAEVFGLSEEYVSTLRGRARREWGRRGWCPVGAAHRRWARGTCTGLGASASRGTPTWRSGDGCRCTPPRWAGRWARGRR